MHELVVLTNWEIDQLVTWRKGVNKLQDVDMAIG